MTMTMLSVLEKEFERVTKKQKTSYAKVTKHLDSLIAHIESFKSYYSSSTSNSTDKMNIDETDKQIVIENGDAEDTVTKNKQPPVSDTDQVVEMDLSGPNDNQNNYCEHRYYENGDQQNEHQANHNHETNININLIKNKNKKSTKPMSSTNDISALNDMITKENYVDKIMTERKEYHLTLSKFGKLIDKNLYFDISKVFPTTKPPLDTKILNQIIASHLYREGRFELAETFLKESGAVLKDSVKQSFVEIYQILNSLSQKNLSPAIQWCFVRRKELEKHKSGMEFELHRLQFIQYLSQNNDIAALAYARQHFPHFANTHMKEIQRLMGSLCYVGRVLESPYRGLLVWNDAITWSNLTSLFIVTACRLLSLPDQSPLLASVNAGALALPLLVKISTIMKGKTLDWNAKEFAVQLSDSEYSYHSIFVCPVSREQSTPENPPMIMSCGHVIARLSMENLSKSSTSRFKCPYCPTEQLPNNGKEIVF